MSRYSSEQLRAMAQEWVVDHIAGGEKSFQVVMQICLRTGLAADVVVHRIESLAQGVDCYA